VKTFRDGTRLIIDIHGMRADAAKFRLEAAIDGCSTEIAEIVVIHGFNQGQALKEMVKELVSSKIIDIKPSLLNEGQTVIRLRRKK
jgi:DNA-nicking Smr family endonuclease